MLALSERPVKVGAVTVSVAVFETPLVPVRVTEVFEATAAVVTVAVAVVAPGATVIDDTLNLAALVLLEPSVTTVPEGPAGAFSVAVSVGFVTPPTIEVDETLTALNTAGLTVQVAVALDPAPEAVTVTAVTALTADSVNVNVPEVLPEAIVIDAEEILRTVLEALRVTTTPAEGAAPLSVTVPVTAVVVPP